MRKYPYVILDVFTDQPMQGNQLAVVHQTRGLTDLEMQSLARETNLSETTFVIQRDPFDERERGIRVRIFTPQEELPFAGHPTLGTAAYLATLSSYPIERVELELNSGKIPVTFSARPAMNGRPQPAFGEMRQADAQFLSVHDRAAVAKMSGLGVDEIREDIPIQTVSTGLPFMIIPVKTLRAMRALGENFSWQTAYAYLNTSDAKFAYFICTETEDAQPGRPKARIHARMIFYNGEDPATGSAAGCAAAYMAKYQIAASGEQVLIEQGVEMKRVSHMYVRADVASDGKVVNVRVGGQSVIVARGEFELP